MSANAANMEDFLEPMTPEGAKEFTDRWLIGEAGTSDALLNEAAQHIYSLLRLVNREGTTEPKAISAAYLRELIHDAEIEAGEEDGDCRLSLGRYTEGVLAALRELEARRHAGA